MGITDIKQYDHGNVGIISGGRTIAEARIAETGTSITQFADPQYNAVVGGSGRGLRRGCIRIATPQISYDEHIINLSFYIAEYTGGASKPLTWSGIAICNFEVGGANLRTNNDSTRSNFGHIKTCYEDSTKYCGSFTDTGVVSGAGGNDGNWYQANIPPIRYFSGNFDIGYFMELDRIDGPPIIGSAAQASCSVLGVIDIDDESLWPYLQMTTSSISSTRSIPLGGTNLAIENNLLLLRNTSINDYTGNNIKCVIGGMPLTATYHNSGYYALNVIIKTGATLSSEENIFMGYPVKTYVDGNQRYFGTTMLHRSRVYASHSVVSGIPLGVDEDGILLCIVRDDLTSRPGGVDEEAEFIWGSSKVTASRIGDDWYWTIVDQS